MKDQYEIQVFNITIPSSIRDFWKSEAYELAIVIAAASLVWPYIKLIILLIVWLYPIQQNMRTKIILFIDQAGKWSYMDLYASVVMTVCFYVHTSFKFKDLHLDIRIVCEPDIGIVTFVIANLLSMAYSHIFIFWDQKYGYTHHVEVWMEENSKSNLLEGKDKKKLPQINGHNDSMSIARPISANNSIGYDSDISRSNVIAKTPPKHVVNVNNGNINNKSEIAKDMKLINEPLEKPRYKISGVYESFYRKDIHLWRMDKDYKIFAMLYQSQSIFGLLAFSFYLMSLLAILYLIIETIYTVPARFDIDGIVGIILGSPANVREYNPIQTANELIPSTDKYHSAIFLSSCYYVTIIIFPIITQIVLILIWFAPVKHKWFVFLLKSIWFVQAWNAFDVFFIGTISGAIEMNMVSEWIIDSTYPGLCGATDGILVEEFGMGCFNVMGTITKGCWMAGVAATFQWYSIWFSLRTAKDIGIHGMEF